MNANPESKRPTVAVIGASRDRAKFGNKSVRAHQRQGYEVFPVNPHADEVEGLPAYPTIADVPVDALDRVSMYVPPEVGVALLEAIRNKNPRELWLNPGSESEELSAEGRRTRPERNSGLQHRGRRFEPVTVRELSRP